MRVIVNRPCGHPLLAVPDDQGDAMPAALDLFHGAAAQPQTELIDVADQQVVMPVLPCDRCVEAMGAYLLASGRKRVLEAAEAHDVSGFAAVDLMELLSFGGMETGMALNPLRAAHVVGVMIHAGWRPTAVVTPTPDGVNPTVAELDPRIVGE